MSKRCESKRVHAAILLRWVSDARAQLVLLEGELQSLMHLETLRGDMERCYLLKDVADCLTPLKLIREHLRD